MPARGSLKSPWFHILLAIADRPLHGYGIRQEVAERTDGTVILWPGVLYRSIKALSSEGWISECEAPEDAPADARERRYFAITASGLSVLAEEVARLSSYLAAAQDKNVPFSHG